jgi:hypothetical protein
MSRVMPYFAYGVPPGGDEAAPKSTREVANWIFRKSAGSERAMSLNLLWLARAPAQRLDIGARH